MKKFFIEDDLRTIFGMWPKKWAVGYIIGKVSIGQIVKLDKFRFVLIITFFSNFTGKSYVIRYQSYRYKQSAVRYAMNHVR